MNRLLGRFVLGAAVALQAWLWPAAPAQALEPVTLQLKWSHAFQFAGYYAAKELGYYREAGLDVTIVEGSPSADSVKNVVRGEAEYGVATSSLLLARQAGQPVVALAVIFQHSPAVLLAPKSGAAAGVRGLLGKRIMIEEQSDELLAYLAREGVGPGRFVQLKHSNRPQDLIDGKVDAISAYLTTEPYYFDQLGFEYEVYTPRAAGIDFYGDNLFTTEAEIRLHPGRAKAFRDASLRGWQYAMTHRRQIAELIIGQYSAAHSLEFYLSEAAAMAPLLRTDLIEIGYMNPERWRHIAAAYVGLGQLPRDFSIQGFLYQPGPKLDLSWLAGALALLAASAALAVYILRTNRRLANALGHGKHTEQALRLSEERHRLLADHASDLIWTMDLDGRFTYLSPSVEKLLGYSPAELMPRALADLLTPASAAVAAAGLHGLVTAIRAGQPVPAFRHELEYPCKEGGSVWTEANVSGMRNGAGQFVGLLGVTRDIGERRRGEERIRHLAQHDMLTGLPNRALFSDRLQLALASARRDRQQLALLFLDLDLFKPVNDRHGHRTGDLLLKEVALRMLDCVRESDAVARIGGDEFMVLLRVVESADGAAGVAEKIRHSLGQPYVVAGHQLRISASIGVAIYPGHGGDEIELTKHADLAMYRAKQAGHDRVQLYQENR
ncbi:MULTISPECIES: diguanylate cyclase domain-containing protein [unclassified Janthinobacterium]|uniref:diguanylate cyclase domain-containing protein n=1 Tax=unclassified Janthinobacterium TaxID=2610881 RepID=UPI0012FBA1C4|nr:MULTISPECIES: diguanylate cyclase [unclassified Janthinobacterium]MEC5159256.1 diguanylate cyclase (GGDEF)-like protein/PAS domain S-box-containing protein [Janthinobacterium sp. CG_S6]